MKTTTICAIVFSALAGLAVAADKPYWIDRTPRDCVTGAAGTKSNAEKSAMNKIKDKGDYKVVRYFQDGNIAYALACKIK